MKLYPSIPGLQEFSKVENLFCIAFDKLDGSNIRFEWTPKKGWWKFGSRNLLFDDKSIWWGSVDIFNKKYANELGKIIKKVYKAEKATVFCEYFGEDSFSGSHNFEKPFDLVLFDVCIHKKGFVKPIEFVKYFQDLGIPEVVYSGPFNKEFIQSVQDNVYNLKEGVIAKGLFPNSKGNHGLWSLKVKTFEWLNKLKEKAIVDVNLLETLSQNREEQNV